MALLNIKVLTASTDDPGTVVSIELTDARGTPITGFDTSGNVIIVPSVSTTDASGNVSVNLTPNADIEPAGSYYTVRVGPRSFLITKTSATQTLREALAVAP